MVIALLAALIAWVVISRDGNGAADDAKSGGAGPARSITPGPSHSGPAISQPPGGRDESGDSGDSDGGSPGAGSDGAGGDTGPGGSASAGNGSGGSASGSASGGGAGGGAGGGSAGEQVPAGSALPNCTSSAMQLSLRTEISYGPDDKPKFQLIAKNTSAADCKADFGPKNAVLTITEAGGDDEQVWSSKDCPADAGRLFLKIPAGATVTHTVEWDRGKSSDKCATPPTGKAGPGTYLLEAKAPGEPLQRASFVLAKD